MSSEHPLVTTHPYLDRTPRSLGEAILVGVVQGNLVLVEGGSVGEIGRLGTAGSNCIGYTITEDLRDPEGVANAHRKQI